LEDFRFSDAMSRWWELSIRHYGTGLLIVLIVALPIALLIIAALAAIGVSLETAAIPFNTVKGSIGVAGIIFLGLVLFAAFGLISGAYCHVVEVDTQRQRIGAMEAIRRSRTRIVSVAGILFLTIFLVMIMALPAAMIATVSAPLGVGGILISILAVVAMLIGMGFILTIYMVATPVSAVEETDAIPAMQRSSALTKGSRWAVFGVYFVISLLIGLATGLPEALVKAFAPVAGAILGGILSLLSAPFSLFVVPAIYDVLRAAREGRPVQQVAEVFS
jgi:hypothetical protein